jgi:broad specificity phosphatase PhoE
MPRRPFKTLFLVRHGRTLLAGTYCGRANPPLSALGCSEALGAARRLARLPIETCFTSPLLRARQTAEIISRSTSIPVTIEPSLRELDFGRWEGLKFKDVEKKWPRQARQWAEDPSMVRIPGGERFSALRKRVGGFLKLISRLKEKNVLIVAHGALLSALTLEAFGLPDREFGRHTQPTGSIRKLSLPC